MEELWKDIPNYEGLYQASNLGRIRTCEGKTTFTKRHGTRHWKQRILKQFSRHRPRSNKIDCVVTLWKDGNAKRLLVSRLVASTFIKNNLFNLKMTINHIDNNPTNNKIENLEWCSKADNIRKGFETGAYSTSKHAIVIVKKTKETIYFHSLTKASLFMGKNHAFVSDHGNGEDDKFKWIIMPF